MKKIFFAIYFTIHTLNAMEEPDSYKPVHGRAYQSDSLRHPINRRLLKEIQNPDREIQKQYIDDLEYYEYGYRAQKLHSALINHPELVANLVTKNGESILHFAIQNHDMSLMNQAIQAGTNISGLNDWSQTPLSYAAIGLDIDAMQTLIDNGCTVDKKILHVINDDDKLKRLSVEETRDSQQKALLLLIEHGADVNAIEYPYDRTVLLRAVEHDNCYYAELLLHNGARTDIKNSKNETPLDIAKSSAMSNLLQEHSHK